MEDAKPIMIQSLIVKRKGWGEVTIKIHEPGRTDNFPKELQGGVWVALGEGGDYHAFDTLPEALEAIKKWLFAMH